MAMGRMSLFRSLVGRPRPAPAAKQVEAIGDGQPLNPFDEFYVLSDHSDIVRHILPIDPTRVATASDDRTVRIWTVEEHRCTQILKGHTLPVTSLLWTTQGGCGRLLTGSADKTILVWNIETGVPVACWSDHGGAVKTLLYLTKGTCCSGGKDICIWHIETNKLVCQHKRDEEDSDVQRILMLGDDRIVTASEEKHMVVYKLTDIDDLSKINIVPLLRLDRHREAIRDVMEVSLSTFATGSLDGVVKLWSSKTLAELHVFNFQEPYQNADHKYNYSVQHIAIFRGAWIVVAIGNGFAVYDTEACKELAAIKHAHKATVNRVFPFGDDLCLATGSADASIRIWSLEKLSASPAGPASKSIQPQLIGELLGHSNCINDLVSVGRGGFVSCGSDGQVILWKNGMVEWERRNEITHQMLQIADDIHNHRGHSPTQRF